MGSSAVIKRILDDGMDQDITYPTVTEQRRVAANAYIVDEVAPPGFDAIRLCVLPIDIAASCHHTALRRPEKVCAMCAEDHVKYQLLLLDMDLLIHEMSNKRLRPPKVIDNIARFVVIMGNEMTDRLDVDGHIACIVRILNYLFEQHKILLIVPIWDIYKSSILAL